MTTAADILGEAAIPELLERIHPVDPEQATIHAAPLSMRRIWTKGTGAMTIGSRIFVRPDLLQGPVGPKLQDLVVHELVHVRQWRDDSPFAFLTGYVRQYLIARLWGARHHVAYMSIEAEVEARRVAAEIRRLIESRD